MAEKIYFENGDTLEKFNPLSQEDLDNAIAELSVHVAYDTRQIADTAFNIRKITSKLATDIINRSNELEDLTKTDMADGTADKILVEIQAAAMILFQEVNKAVNKHVDDRANLLSDVSTAKHKILDSATMFYYDARIKETNPDKEGEVNE